MPLEPLKVLGSVFVSFLSILFNWFFLSSHFLTFYPLQSSKQLLQTFPISSFSTVIYVQS